MTKTTIATALAIVMGLATAMSAARGDEGHAHHASAGAEVLGEVHFPINCTPEAQGRFDKAMLLQHSFWYRQAAQEFRSVREVDPGCTMSYWGEAMTRLLNPFNAPIAQNLEAGQALLAEARKQPARSEREAAYIDALSEAFAGIDVPGHRARLERYEEAMGGLHARYPDDSEAAILYALALNIAVSPTDKTYSKQLRAAEILEQEFSARPNHPGVAHYLIHTYDVPALAQRGLPSAERYSQIAPDAPHALHMPSHIFTRVGYWQASADTNRRSADVARASSEVDDELHATDYMVYAYLQQAKDNAARTVMNHLAGYSSTATKRNAGPFALAAVPARYALERGDWEAASKLTVGESNYRYIPALTHFARAIGAARGGRPDQANADIDALKRIADELRPKDRYWAEQVAIQSVSAEGWAAFAAGQREQGIAILRQAADREALTEKAPITPGPLAPARELLAEALLASGDFSAALIEFERVQQTEPNRFRSVLGAARAAKEGDRSDDARRHYTKLLEIAAAADTQRPELAEARKYLSQG